MPDKELKVQVAKNIAKYRKMVGITQVHLAEKISVEKETVSRMEAGKVTPSLSRLASIADALGCPVAALVRNETENTQSNSETIADMISPLSAEEQGAVVRFVGDAVRLLRGKYDENGNEKQISDKRSSILYLAKTPSIH